MPTPRPRRGSRQPARAVQPDAEDQITRLKQFARWCASLETNTVERSTVHLQLIIDKARDALGDSGA